MARITFEGRRYPVRRDETALDALLRGGANVAFSCKNGVCQTCLVRAADGDPGEEARAGLREGLRERGYFLPCRARPTTDLTVERADLAELFVRARVHDKVPLSPRIVRLRLETETTLSWRAGQIVNVRRPKDGLVRSYSLASIAEDYFLELHVDRVPGGAMSPWLCDEVEEGDELDIQGPMGSCFYSSEARDRNLLLVGTGTGLAPLLGVARDALLGGHRGEIHLHHGARDRDGLYHHALLRELEAAHPRFRATQYTSRDTVAGVTRGRAVDGAFSAQPDLRGWVGFFCGRPEVVYAARVRAVAAGVLRADIHADAFEPLHPFAPDDSAKIAGIEADPEMWAALRGGPGLTEILQDFYGRVFEDARLAPFFLRTTKQRAIEKQHEFLRDLFTGKREYFGLRPFNAYHWMIISDELFDHREALFEECLRRYGLAEHLVRRWSALHEMFRREIVKGTPRGLIVDGVEELLEGYGEEMLTVGSLCDGCGGEMAPGSLGRYHRRTGQLYCRSCGARRVGATERPAAPSSLPPA